MILSKNLVPFGLGLLVVLFSGIQDAEAEVWIPEDEFISYVDTNGFYTVVGTIKNSEKFPVIPTVTISIQDGENLISKSYEYVAIQPSKEIPFKIKFPEVASPSPILNSPDISYVRTEKTPLDIEVIYDDTLVQYDDGHLTGRLINKGDSTVYNIKVFAIIHGYERVLDMGQNIEMIEKMEPGEIRTFSMYPDPSITEDVYYYSCFAIGDPLAVLNAKRNDEQYVIRILSLHTISYPEFDDEGRNLSLSVIGSWPDASFANFEFPLSSEKERFNVFLNDEPIEFIQSIDELKNWHVAFNLPPHTQGELLITGFEEKPLGLNSQKDMELPSDIEITVFNPPLKQLQIGIEPENVVCKEGLKLLLKQSNGKPACVKPTSVAKLIERGWALEISLIESFEECVAAGNPVMESYPRQCRTSDGKHFVEVIPETETQFFLEFNKTGGIAGIRESIIIDSSENELIIENMNEKFTTIILESEIVELKILVDDSGFFAIEEKNYPPQEGWADYFTYSLKIVSGNVENTITWSDASKITPDAAQTIVKQLEYIKNQNFRG